MTPESGDYPTKKECSRNSFNAEVTGEWHCRLFNRKDFHEPRPSGSGPLATLRADSGALFLTGAAHFENVQFHKEAVD